MYLIPKPKKISVTDGFLNAKALTAEFGEFSSEQVLRAFEILEKETADNCKENKTIKLIIIKKDEYTDCEEYSLKIDGEGINIYAGDARGVFYAIQTLRQIVYT